MTTQNHFDILNKEGFTEDQIGYLNRCFENREWEEYDIQRRWISAISDMSHILYEWDITHQSHTNN